jgi:hypothetical protein
LHIHVSDRNHLPIQGAKLLQRLHKIAMAAIVRLIATKMANSSLKAATF